MRPRILAIDWSGAKKTARNKARCEIAVAVLEPWACSPRLLWPAGKEHWTRTDVYEFLLQQAKGGIPAVAGIDGNFALPFVDCGQYVPGSEKVFAQGLWAEVDKLCEESEKSGAYPGADGFYPRPFADAYSIANGGDFHVEGQQPENYKRRFRETENIARAIHDVDPISPFELVGVSVGMSGLAAMRVLHCLNQRKGVAVWPFEPRERDTPLTAVEIYPAFFRNTLNLHANNLDELNTALKELDFGPINGVSGDLSEHQIDALASVAGMAVVMCDPKVWTPLEMSEQARRTEGWIFGVGADWTGP